MIAIGFFSFLAGGITLGLLEAAYDAHQEKKGAAPAGSTETVQ